MTGSGGVDCALEEALIFLLVIVTVGLLVFVSCLTSLKEEEGEECALFFVACFLLDNLFVNLFLTALI
jgi:hypothetical protein